MPCNPEPGGNKHPFEVGNGATVKKRFSDNFVLFTLGSISATRTGGGVGGDEVSCGQLSVCGNKAEQMQHLYAADHISWHAETFEL